MDKPLLIETAEPPNKKIKRINPDQTISTSTSAMEIQNQDTMNEISVKVDLVPAEQLLRKLLLDCRDSILSQTTINDDKDSNSNIKTGNVDTGTSNKATAASSRQTINLGMWFVGGWVRDKLLGKQSSDIDIALSGMTGPEFARHLKSFLSESANDRSNTDRYKEEATERGVLPDIRGFHQIDRNPDKGKHLETTSAQIFGLEVDFVNLRKESTFHEEKENDGQQEEEKEKRPTFNSAPEEDAFRRDANVNAIFYNLETQQIEDYTKKGLIDIQARVLRTPLDAYITFTDDPLRVLRLIRLASKLGFTIGANNSDDNDADNTRQAMKDPNIQLALSTKISHERIGSELKKMLTGPDPVTAFRWIYELRLYGSIFLDFREDAAATLRSKRPEILDMIHGGEDGDGHPWPSTWLRTCVALSGLLNANDGGIFEKEITQSEDRESIWQMAAWSPLAQLRRGDIDIDSILVKAASRAISAPSKKWKLLGESFKNMDSIQSIIEQVNDSIKDNNINPPPRSTIGVTIRSWGVTWRLQVLYSLLSELITLTEKTTQPLIVDRYATFLRFVSDHNLNEAPTMKPVLTGGDIKTMFGLKKSGAFMKGVFDAILCWQLDRLGDDNNHGDVGLMREEAEEWLRAQKERLHIPDPEV